MPARQKGTHCLSVLFTIVSDDKICTAFGAIFGGGRYRKPTNQPPLTHLSRCTPKGVCAAVSIQFMALDDRHPDTTTRYKETVLWWCHPYVTLPYPSGIWTVVSEGIKALGRPIGWYRRTPKTVILLRIND